MQSNVTSMPQRPGNINLRPIEKDLTKEYVVSGGYTAGQQRILAGTLDELEIELDPQMYDRMETDSTIIKSKKIITTGVLSDDLQLAPGATEDEVGADEYEVYERVMELCQRSADGLTSGSLIEALEQILGNAIKYGHGIAETEWEYRLDGESTESPKPTDTANKKSASMWARFGYFFGWKEQAPQSKVSDSVLKRPTLSSQQTRLMPKAIKVKPRGAARFVVDDYMNVLGLAPRHKNGTNLSWNSIVDRQKFLVLTLNKKDEDPRGVSSYRPAYNWWNVKTQLPAEMLRLVLEEIVPKVVAVLPENVTKFEIERDRDGVPVMEEDGVTPKMRTAADSVRDLIENFRGGSGVVVPHGTEFRPFKTGGTGTDADLVARIIKIIGDQIEDSILLQTLAQSEGEHQARSASQQVAQLLHNLIFWTRRLIAIMLLGDLFEVVVRVNLGEWAVRYLPQVSLGDFVRRDWGDDLAKVADGYFKGFIDDTQRPELMAWLNLPRPGPSRQEQNAEAVAKQDVNGQPAQPNSNRSDKNAGTGRNNGNGTEKKNDNNKAIFDNATNGRGLNYALGHHTRGSGFIRRYIFSGRK